MAKWDVDVRIGAQAVPVGRLVVESDGARRNSMFAYHQSWIDDPRGFDLAPSMPRQAAPIFTVGGRGLSVLPGPIDDGAPDSWGRKIIEKTRGSGALEDIEYLVGTSDFLRIGALRYFDKAGPEGAALAPHVGAGAPGIPRLETMDKVVHAARAFEADPERFRETRANLIAGDILRDAVGSLGGARPKINAVDQTGALWIVKLPKQADTYAMARAEAMALRLAARCGIAASKAIVMNDAPNFPLIRVRRFDRTGPDGQARIPFISASSLLGVRGPDEVGTYEDIAFAIRQHGANVAAQIQELYRRMAFTILLRNTDDHLRNHGFLRTPEGWVLSPAFDINPEHRTGGALQTPISEMHGAQCSIRAALDAAEYFDLSMAKAREIVAQMAETIGNSWRVLGGELGMTATDFAALTPVIENEDIEWVRRGFGGAQRP